MHLNSHAHARIHDALLDARRADAAKRRILAEVRAERRHAARRALASALHRLARRLEPAPRPRSHDLNYDATARTR